MSEPTEEEIFAQVSAEIDAKNGKQPIAEVQAPEAGEADPAVEAVAAAAEPAPVVEDEPFPGFNALPEEARTRFTELREKATKADELEKRARKLETERLSMQGVVAPTQRELENARKRIRELESAESEKATAAAQAKFKKYQEDYPDEAEPLAAIRGEMQSELEKLKEAREAQAKELQEIQKEIYLNKATSELSKVHPDYLEIDEDPVFKEWLEASHPIKKHLLRTGVVADTAEVLNDFKREKLLAAHLNGQAAPVTTAAVKPMARADADPNPILRKTSGTGRSTSSRDVMEGEDEYIAGLQSAGRA